jgi:hypothetical protein
MKLDIPAFGRFPETGFREKNLILLGPVQKIQKERDVKSFIEPH